MSDQRRTDLSQPEPQTAATASGRRHPDFRRRLPIYAAGLLVAILALAWIDGGAEPLHPITQSVDLKSDKSGAQ